MENDHCKSTNKKAAQVRRQEDAAIKKGRRMSDGSVVLNPPSGSYRLRVKIELVDGTTLDYPLTFKQRKDLRKSLGLKERDIKTV